ncbi:MAG: hypothetical protein L3K08_06265, partial [Thermoplasmata archaeon]|nr:hypothetical protein [Thermoplasmata archaeon]
APSAAALAGSGALTLTARAFGRNGSGAIERSRTHRSTAPIRFQCTSCGQDIGAPSWWPVHPRIGGPGGASYSFRCSRCGERGWQHRIA